MSWTNCQVLTGIVDEAARTCIGAPINLIRNKAASVSLSVPGITADTPGCRIDRMRRSLQKTIEVIPSQGLDEVVMEWIIRFFAQMEFAEVSAIVPRRFSNFGVVASNGDTCELARSSSRSAPNTLVRSGNRPSKNTARLGEHSGMAHTFRKRTPARVMASIFGVFAGSTPP